MAWKEFFQRWIVTTVGVLVAANVVGGIHYESAGGLLVASLLLGVLNAFIRPVMVILALPLLLVTFGLFLLVINALLLYFVGWLVGPFDVHSFWAAFWGGVIISIVSFFANALLGTARAEVRVQRGPPRGGGDPGGSGPVIDV